VTYRVGIVGSGFGGSVHAPAFTLHPQFEPVAIASPTNAERVAKARNIPHAFPSLDALLRGVDVDVVAIASPPFDHHAAVLAALAAGKHVLCEKPFALNVAQAQELVAAAERAGTACAIAHEFRYAPAEASLHALVAGGKLGGVRHIEVTRFGNELRAASERPRSAWWFSRALGGGVANSIVPHLVDLANWFAGRAPVHVHGFGRTVHPQRRDADGAFASDVFDGVFAVLDYGNGLAARITADSTTSMNQCTVALHAEDITVVANGEGLVDMRLFSVEPDEQSELELSASPYAKYVSLAPNMPPFLALLDDYAERIASGGGTAPTFEDALATQRVLEAIGYRAEPSAAPAARVV
jgi:predicted dehydrogenase